MKFFFDENMSPTVVDPLRPLLGREHELVSIFEHNGGRLVSADDDALIQSLQSQFDVMVTQDRSQLRNHREALLDSGLHWVGLNVQRQGDLHGLAASAACLMAGLPHALDTIGSWAGTNGCWITLRGLQREAKQRITVRNAPEMQHRARVTRLTS
ncbi:hypothetical protein [Terrabacter sp. Root181]|uniref:PIN-like domain-containing protein n=1 Tax=Terrabacter sp. Root181 TaxID=1736484 RepID=UPI0006F9D9EE|nr:hypothetical protein [Terrabacter sp. Root181]KRB47590.1 hypothetical protein ASD90_04465 [Terrabacter sp. Root181]